jgi:DnaK suppressor protein
MEEKDLIFFKTILTNWLRELLCHSENTIVNLRDHSEHLPDPLDRAAFDTDRNFRLRIRDRESGLIKKIRQSLEDIENEEYGICVACGEEISIERLKARPVAKHCIKCKTEIEKFERVIGA